MKKILNAIVRFAREVVTGSPLTREQQLLARDVERDLDGYKYSRHSVQSQGSGIANPFLGGY